MYDLLMLSLQIKNTIYLHMMSHSTFQLLLQVQSCTDVWLHDWQLSCQDHITILLPRESIWNLGVSRLNRVRFVHGSIKKITDVEHCVVEVQQQDLQLIVCNL